MYIVTIVETYKFHTSLKSEALKVAKELSEQLRVSEEMYKTVYVDSIDKMKLREYFSLNFDNEFLVNNSEHIEEF